MSAFVRKLYLGALICLAALGCGSLSESGPGGACETPRTLESRNCATGYKCIATRAYTSGAPGTCWAECAGGACPGSCTCGTTRITRADGGTFESEPHCLRPAGGDDSRCDPN